MGRLQIVGWMMLVCKVDAAHLVPGTRLHHVGRPNRRRRKGFAKKSDVHQKMKFRARNRSSNISRPLSLTVFFFVWNQFCGFVL